ncbi:MAG: germination protein YpeB [Firmicutes bacterium]|nr:germination protein YpeB [Bacillota bacterium]
MYRKWLLPLGLLALALGAGYWFNWQQNENRMLRTALDNNYQRAFYNLADQVQNAEVLLGKALVTADPVQIQSLFEQVREQSSQALDSLTQLPVQGELLGRTAKFIVQLGDYSHSLAEQVAMGKAVSGEQWDTLNRLYNQASGLNTELGRIHAEVADGRFSFTELAVSSSRRLAKEGRTPAGAGFQDMDNQMQKYPSLIYDGPFSDHLEQGNARGVTGDDITPAQAKAAALRYLDIEKGEDVTARVTGTVETDIKAYRVEMILRREGEKQGEPAIADITRRGGHLVWMLYQRDIPGAGVSINEAGKLAAGYLEERGYGPMKLSYHQRNDNTVTFNFAYMQDDVIIYPDLVKVTVARDNGRVVAVDTRTYLMSHHRRDLSEPQVTERQARELVSGRLQIQDRGRLALIPLDPDKELLTWEFKGTLGEDSYLVYINAMNGREENVLRLIENQDGVLTM